MAARPVVADELTTVRWNCLYRFSPTRTDELGLDRQ